ncbi:hypothetical protein, partial [Klebsiella oxytoca]
GAGSFGIVAPMISVAGIGQAAMPSFTPTPPPDSEQDIVSRLFYDKAGNRIGALDGEGYLTRTVYDAAGRKVQDIAYANAASAALRAT